MAANFDFEVYDGKSFKDLCKEVVDRSQSKKDQLDTLMSDLRSKIKDENTCIVFMPKIKELLEVGIKNDEQIVKLCAVIQRIQAAQIEASGGQNTGLTEAEKEQLQQAQLKELEILKDIKKTTEEPLPAAAPTPK